MDTLYHETRHFKLTRKERLLEKRNQILITEFINLNDPRYRIPKAEQAKEKEILNLVRRRTQEIASEEEVPKNANIIGGRLFMTISDTETDSPLYKARYVMRGHRDREEKNLVHETTTIDQSSIRILLLLETIFDFNI